jgi:hypothetical protein
MSCHGHFDVMSCHACREYALTAVMKLTARYPNQLQRLQALLGRHMRSSALEVQSRSAEFGRMFKLQAGTRSQVGFGEGRGTCRGVVFVA